MLIATHADEINLAFYGADEELCLSQVQSYIHSTHYALRNIQGNDGDLPQRYILL